jgi:hypothetical protein
VGSVCNCAHAHYISLLPGLSFVPLQTWSKILAISGILTMGLALLGCVGALRELRCLLGLVSAHPSPSQDSYSAPLRNGLGRDQPNLSTLPPVFWDAVAPVCHADNPGNPHLHSADPGELGPDTTPFLAAQRGGEGSREEVAGYSNKDR